MTTEELKQIRNIVREEVQAHTEPITKRLDTVEKNMVTKSDLAAVKKDMATKTDIHEIAEDMAGFF